MSVRSTLLSRIAAFRAQYAVGRQEFGRLAVNQRDFILYLEKRRGRGDSLKVIERAEAFMAAVEADPSHLTASRERLGIEPKGGAAAGAALNSGEVAEPSGQVEGGCGSGAAVCHGADRATSPAADHRDGVPLAVTP